MNRKRRHECGQEMDSDMQKGASFVPVFAGALGRKRERYKVKHVDGSNIEWWD